MRANLYHTHHLNYLEDLPYWITLADQANGPVLELGCGTGRILHYLREEGFTVYGLDHDMRMLHYFKRNTPAAPVFAADLTRFHLGRKFAFIFLGCNTYSTLSADQRRMALTCIDQHLLPGGLFAASLPNPLDLIEMGDSSEIGPEESFFDPETGDPVQVSSSWQTNQDTVTIFWHYDQLYPDGQVDRTTHSTTHFRDPAETYIREMQDQGFEVQTDGEYHGAPYGEDTDLLILRAYKK